VVAICLGSFIVNIPLALVQRVQYAQQQVAQSNLWQAAGSVLALGLAGVAVATGAGGPVVIAAGVFAVPLTNLANSLYCFGVRSPELRPHWRGVDRATARVLMRLGARFFLLSVLTSVALNLDNILVARTLGLGAAAHYAVIARLFTALSLLMALVCLPLWPANAEALARGDVAWVRRTTRRMSMVAAGVVAVGGLLLMIFGAPVVALWLHEDGPSAASPALLGGLGLSCVLIAATSPLFSVQNSVGLLRPQLVGWSVYLVVSVMLKLRFVGWWGLAGVPAGSALAFALILMPTAWLGYQRTLAASIRGEAHAGAR
jgi:O-antigen/teichoic acid export membrane protein